VSILPRVTTFTVIAIVVPTFVRRTTVFGHPKAEVFRAELSLGEVGYVTVVSHLWF